MKRVLIAVCTLLFLCSPSAFADESRIVLTEAARLGVSYRIRYACIQGVQERCAARTVHVDLGPMSYAQFSALTKAYGGAGTVPYARGKVYELLDFMPPKIQALAGMRFNAANERAPDWVDGMGIPCTFPEVRTRSNCWTTAYELVRAQDPALPMDVMHFFWVPSSVMTQTLMDTRYSQSVESEEDLQSGDALLIFDVRESITRLAHVSLRVDQGLYFEKAGTDVSHPYRFASFSDLSAGYHNAMVTGKFEFRRYKRAGVAGLEPPMERFSMGARSEFRALSNAIPVDEMYQLSLTSWRNAQGAHLGLHRILPVPIRISPTTGRGELAPPQGLEILFERVRCVPLLGGRR